MIVTGFPRSGSSLLLLLLAGTVTSKKVYYEREDARRADDKTISKCPFALIRREWPKDQVLLIVRDPRAVVTSDTHRNYKGYVIGWQHGKAPYGLRKHWEAMQPYLGESYMARYEDLVADPDRIQDEIGERFGLVYQRRFSEWPEGFRVAEYWRKTGLGEIRPFQAPRPWDDTEAHRERAREQAELPGFRECCEALGYG